MSAVHQILSSSRTALGDCEAFVHPGDLLLLVDEGVCLLFDARRARDLIELAGSGHVSALKADVEARGLVQCAHELEIELLTDLEWVGAVRSHDAVLSWR